MPQILVTIDAKNYRMACEEGQEEHLHELARGLDGYIGDLRKQFGQIGDQRLTVMAAIMIMDELQEARRKIAGLESETGGLRKTRDAALVRADEAEGRMAAALEKVTEKIELISTALEQNHQ